MHLATHASPDYALILCLALWLLSPLSAHASATEVARGGAKHEEVTTTHIGRDALPPRGLHNLETENEGHSYEASFPGIPRDIIGRAGVFLTGLQPDTPQRLNILPGSTVYYSFEVKPTSTPDNQRRSLKDVTEAVRTLADVQDVHEDHEKLEAEGERDEAGEGDIKIEGRQNKGDQAANVYVSINTCLQPSFHSKQDQKTPPQLSLLTLPIRSGQQFDDKSPTGFQSTQLNLGYAGVTVRAARAILIAVAAPNASRLESTVWNFDVAASLSAPYHSFDTTPPTLLKLIDSDPHAALLITDGLEDWSKDQANKTYGLLSQEHPPLDIFANNINFTGLVGLDHSYCAQYRAAQIQGSTGSRTYPGFEKGLTIARPSKLTEQQFYLPGLNASSTYYGRLATLNASEYGASATVGGGGTLYPAMNFTTKHDENCAVVYNLSFCADVNYAVPANPARYDRAALTDLYDSNAARLYQNFSYSLQQIPCNTTPTAQYSLAVTCDDCAAAYKTWLCAVTIPKCMDFSANFGVNTIPDSFLTSTDSRAISSKEKFGLRAGDDGQDVVQDDDHNQSDSQEDPVAVTPSRKKNTPYLMPRNLAQAPLVPTSSASSSSSSSSTSASGTPNVNTTLLNTLATNSSRAPSLITAQIAPGPYLEVLPCADLCYDLVRMCPAKLGFQCPTPGSRLEGVSYGYRGVGAGGAYTCNAPGAVYYPNAGLRQSVSSASLMAALLLAVGYGLW